MRTIWLVPRVIVEQPAPRVINPAAVTTEANKRMVRPPGSACRVSRARDVTSMIRRMRLRLGRLPGILLLRPDRCGGYTQRDESGRIVALLLFFPPELAARRVDVAPAGFAHV